MTHSRSPSGSSPAAVVDGSNTDTPRAQRHDPFEDEGKKQAHSARQHPLTPPLTPASSFNSVLSSSSSNSEGSTNCVRQDIETQPEATHFLLLGGLLKTVSQDNPLQAVITEALSSIGSSPSSVLPGKDGVPAETDIIRATNTKRVESHGEAILAFHDVRDAITARHTLSTAKSSSLSCRFLTKSEILELIGTSQVLTSIDGELLVCPEGYGQSLGSDGDFEDETRTSFFEQELRDLFQKYGDLRSFECQHVQNKSPLFRVEYLDYRAAHEAQSECQGQIIHGTKLNISRRTQTAGLPTVDAHDYKQVTSGIEETPRAAIGVPGQVSQIRERFHCHSTPSKSERRVSDTSSSQAAPNSNVYFTAPGQVPSGQPAATTWYHPVHSQYVNMHNKPPIDPRTARGPIPGNTQSPEASYPHSFFSYSPETYYQAPPGMTHIPYYHHPQSTGSPTSASPVFYHHTHMMAQPPMPYPASPTPSNYDHEAGNGAVTFFPYPYVYDASGMASPSPVPYPMSYVPVQGLASDSEVWKRARSGSDTFYAAPPMLPSYYPVQSPSPRSSPSDEASSPPYFSNDGTSSATSPTRQSRHPSSPTLISNKNRDANNTPERNQLNIARIEDGQDTRTTVMIKNIPNKMTDKDLVTYIGKVCPRRIDFLYLRMDFKNGCNVGYAFVNFITVQDLLTFAKKRLGEKWNMFSSEKVLQMSYANYQGKEALIEKFKNSCIMDEREAWRPKIFFSDGPEQGLPQEFPPPTHLRRKERSSFNRGALYVPGLHNGGIYRQDLSRKPFRDNHHSRGECQDDGAPVNGDEFAPVSQEVDEI